MAKYRQLMKIQAPSSNNKIALVYGNITSIKKFVFCDDNDESKIHKFRVEIKIRNLKEEVKDDNVESGVSDTDE